MVSWPPVLPRGPILGFELSTCRNFVGTSAGVPASISAVLRVATTKDGGVAGGLGPLGIGFRPKQPNIWPVLGLWPLAANPHKF